MTVIMNGNELSKKIKENLRLRATKLKEQNIEPSLVVVLVGEDPASQVYVRNKTRAAEQIGINAIDIRLPETTTEAEILDLIAKYNADETVHGILVQLPLPKHINEDRITQAISPLKDVDGFHPVNMGHLFMNEPLALPCTPHGIMEFFKEYNIDVTGKNAVVIGRSNIVGRPMAALLLNANATVTVTHSRTQNLKEIAREADILVVAIGRGEFVDADYVKEGAVVIDVGMNRNAAGKLVGDVDFASVNGKAGYLTPVPRGVGPMTIAMLMQQTIEFAERSLN
ncbi:bifunctional methylenetetrahydrofolate dehydrogenase/methenyltetrahydrofolate cyclohydrolase FolD [Ligilactobacillus ceti]|uniref:Bifunctional protein FolD n=1 Tax=Ligilactobacillus ceti DSM 22408 TaxID=1122146 RepID=A0A0R2KR45_9LACO|nr:bifunctional methylenetetrahydrofolate dehydrogenase/methenyltetrahydrofolate cyclohydrolase FolD [Ligilactobacillus ceti]KRN88669.1 tetrahydrofolate dehydrogenase cyclohydrolase, catalytic domain protein [Ligilactobacillus ceti DSM 22408]